MSGPRKRTTIRHPAASPQAGASDRPGPVGPVRPDLVLPADPVGNLFSRGRAGRPAVRPDDLLALRLELVDLAVVPGTPPRLQAQGNAARLVLHLPPQSIAEEVFYEQAADGHDTGDITLVKPGKSAPPIPPGTGHVDPPPIRARAAGESRLVFACPPGFACDYTLEGILQAIQSLAMAVPAAALPPQAKPSRPTWPWPGDLPIAAGVIQRPLARAAFSLRQAQIALRGGPAAEATLRRRLADLAPALRPDVVPHLPPLQLKPHPALPGAHETALELPWRLLIAPHAQARWRHAPLPRMSAPTGHTELWHTRLLGSAPPPGKPDIEPPHDDGTRTVRAVWATTGFGGQALDPHFPSGGVGLPLPGENNPFTPNESTLTDYDRYQIAHLSANFSVSNYAPEPINTHLLMLSTLGGWLDSRGDWEPPGVDLESWVHRASMGRDHYVRVVYRGLLFPLGHRAALIKVSERKFHKDAAGNAAYLRQRFFLMVRERERDYSDAYTLNPYGPNNARVKNEFPFSRVRILTQVTPDLKPPTTKSVAGQGQRLFWPMLSDTEPFRFRMVATDLDGRDCQFDLPLIFMSNQLASPRLERNGKLSPLYSGITDGIAGAADAAQWALAGWLAQHDWTHAPMNRQRLTLAPSARPGDTAVEALDLEFGAHVPEPTPGPALNAFKAYSQSLTRPMFFPRINATTAILAPLAQLTGSTAGNRLLWNDAYAKAGFEAARNKGEVFVDIDPGTERGALDFSRQGDRSGGFVMPNLLPSAVSRVLGPVAGDIASVRGGEVLPDQFFPSTPVLNGLPLPLLFGCIPLSAVLDPVGDFIDELGKAPKFVSEAASKLESFFSELMQLYQRVADLPAQPAALAGAALEVLGATLGDLGEQAKAFTAAQAAALQARVKAITDLIEQVRTQLDTLSGRSFDAADPLAGIDLDDLLDPPQGNGQLRALLEDLRTTVVGMAQLPAGFRQSVNAAIAGAGTLINGLSTIAAVYAHGQVLYDALKELVANDAPGQSLGDLVTRPADLAARLSPVADALGDVRTDIAGFALLEGPPRDALLGTLDGVKAALEAAGGVASLLENLLGEELVLRFDWKPPIKSWSIDGSTDYLFVVHDSNAFVVAVEARVKKSGGAPKIQVLCGLHHFDLVLVAPASFLELNFQKIEFKVDSSAKMGVDVLLDDIKFVGPLSFVETLRDLIPLDGFSDPPYLDISAQGIDAGFDVSLPSITCGVLNISNLSLGAGFTVPFIGQPLSVRFNFCTREQPFHLTVWCFGGGGFFGITLDPSGIQLLEAAFEFGAAISVDFGVASGGVSVMAGIYFRMEKDECSLTGYFRLEGHVNVLGLITASLELYLELRYEFESGKCVGRAELTIEISVFIFSGSVTISCEKKFAGSNGDPTLRQLMGLSTDPLLPLADELAMIGEDTEYGWRAYCDAFA